MKISILSMAGSASGAENYLIDLTRWLSERNVSVSFIARLEGKFKDTLKTENIPYIALPRRGRGALLSPVTLASYLKEQKSDILVVNREHDIILGYLSLKIANLFLRKKIKIIAMLHTPTGRKIPLLKYYDVIVCTSEHTKKSFINSNRFFKKKTTVIHPGIHLWEPPSEEKFDLYREKKYFNTPGSPLIGMIGELWKNQEELVDVAKYLVPIFPDIKIAVVGGGYKEQFESLEKKIEKSNLKDHFILTGRVPRDVIADIFFDLDLSVSTHRNEGFGIVHIESLAAHTPVVAYRSGGYVEMLSQGGGILVDGGPEDLARAITRLLTKHEERRRLALEGRKIVEDYYTLERMGREHMLLYEELVRRDG